VLGYSALSEHPLSSIAGGIQSEFAANLTGSAVVGASLTTGIRFEIVVLADVNIIAWLSTPADFFSGVTGSATLSGTLSMQAQFAAAMDASAVVTADLGVAAQFEAALVGSFVVGALDLVTVITLEVNLVGVASLQADIVASALMTSTGIVTTPEIWSDYEAAGGVRLGWLPYVMAFVETYKLDGNDQLKMQYPIETTQAPLLTVDAVIRTVFNDGTFSEWRIDSVERQTGSALIEVTGAPVRRELLHSLIDQTDADGFVYFDVPVVQITPANIISNYILANAPSWIVLGTVTPTDKLDMNFGNDTSGSGLTRLEEVTGYEAEFAPNGTTQYDLNLWTRGASATALRLRTGRNLIELKEQKGAERITVITGYGADGATIAWAYWEVETVSGAGPYQVKLKSIHGGDPPILEDDQLNTLYLEDDTGTLVQIDDTFFSTQEVEIASLGSIAVGDWVRVVLNSSGKHLTSLDATAAKAAIGTRRGEHQSNWDNTVNILKNGIPSSWPGAYPDDWTIGAGTWAKETGANNWLFAMQSLKGTNIGSAHSVTCSRTWHTTARENVYSASVWVRPTTITPGAGLGMKFTALGQTLYYTSPINAWVLLKIENVTVTTGNPTLSAALGADTGSTWTGYVAGFQINKGPIAKPMTLGSNAARIWQGMNQDLTKMSVEYVTYSGKLVDFEAAGLTGEQIVIGQTVEATTTELGDFSARLVEAVFDRLNPNNTGITLSTQPPLASRELSGPPVLNVPFFEPIDLQAVRRDRIQNAMFIEATITGTTDTTVTILLDVRDAHGLSPAVSYAAYGASYVSGSGAGPYVFNRPAVGAGMGRVVFTAKLPERADVTDSVDVTESIPSASTPVIVAKAEVQSSSATQIVVRVSAASATAGTGTINYTTDVTVAPSGGGTATLLADIDDVPGAGEYIDYTIDRPAFGSGTGRVQFNVVAVGYVGGAVPVDIPAVEQDTDTIALSSSARVITINATTIVVRFSVADPDPPGGATVVSTWVITSGTVTPASGGTMTPEDDLEKTANWIDYTCDRPTADSPAGAVTFTGKDTVNNRVPTSSSVEIPPQDPPEVSVFHSTEVSDTQWKITWTVVTGTIEESKNQGTWGTPTVTSGTAFNRPAYGTAPDVYAYRVSNGGITVPVGEVIVPPVVALNVTLTLNAALGDDPVSGDVSYTWSATGMPTGVTYDIDWELFDSSNNPTGAKGYAENVTSTYDTNPSPAFNGGDKYKYTIIAYDGNGVVIKTKSRSGTATF